MGNLSQILLNSNICSLDLYFAGCLKLLEG